MYTLDRGKPGPFFLRGIVGAALCGCPVFSRYSGVLHGQAQGSAPTIYVLPAARHGGQDVCLVIPVDQLTAMDVALVLPGGEKENGMISDLSHWDAVHLFDAPLINIAFRVYNYIA